LIDSSDVSTDATDLRQKLDLMETHWQDVEERVEQQKSVVDSRLALWHDYRQLLERLTQGLDEVSQSIDEHPVTSCDTEQAKHLLDVYHVSGFAVLIMILMIMFRCQQ